VLAQLWIAITPPPHTIAIVNEYLGIPAERLRYLVKGDIFGKGLRTHPDWSGNGVAYEAAS